MFVSVKHLILFVAICFIGTVFLSALSSSRDSAISPEQIKDLSSVMREVLSSLQHSSAMEHQKTGTISHPCPTLEPVQAEKFPTLMQIRQIVQQEVSNLGIPIQKTSPEDALVYSGQDETEQYQQILHDSNNMLSKVLSNQKLNKQEREKWGQDHSRLNTKDRSKIIEQIVSAINNQELLLDEPLDLPF